MPKMNLRKLVRFFSALAALAPLSLAAAVSFGRFGESLEQAKKTHFFTWFHLEQTAVEGDARIFQPSGEKFHALVKVTVDSPAGGSIRRVALAVQPGVLVRPASGLA